MLEPNEYKAVSENELKNYFMIKKQGEIFNLKVSNHCKPIFVKLPFIFNEEVASLAGLMPDGSLIRDLMRIYFTQKKDLRKIELFDNLIKKLFSSEIKIFKKIDIRGATNSYINSKTLAYFFYFILNVSKSDQQQKVPYWVFTSSRNVKITYLKQIFDMEGTISKRLTEIRFVSKDELFIQDVKKLLSLVEIGSHVTFAPRVKQKSGQYRLSIYRRENFEKFKDIGFRIPFLHNRFQALISKYGL